MQPRHFNFDALLTGYLAYNEAAASQLIMHIEQKELIEPEITRLLTCLKAEIEKPDAVCNSNALALAGLLYGRGWYVSQDIEYAIVLLKRAISLNNAYAMNNLGVIYSKSEINPDLEKELYEKAIALGNTTAMCNYATDLTSDPPSQANYEKAIALLDEAISCGNVYALTWRARMHENGLGCPVNYDAAIALYDQAILLNHVCAITNRAQMHRKGQGGSVNYEAAIPLYDQAILLNNATAMNDRAYIHDKGLGCQVNYGAAIALYDQAILLNNPTSMNNRALMHENGRGCAVNYEAAIALYDQAISLKYILSMINCSVLYLNKLTSPTNNIKAAYLFRQAMRLDDIKSKYNTQYHFIINALKTDKDLQIQYHLSLLDKIDKTLPNEFINLYIEHPKEIEVLLSNDDLFTNEERKIVADFLGQYYFEKAIQKLKLISENKSTYDTEFLTILDNIPENSSRFKESLIFKTDYLVNALHENMVETYNIPDTLQAILTLHDTLLDKDCLELTQEIGTIKNQLADMSFSSNTIIAKQNTQERLSCIEKTISKLNDIRNNQQPIHETIKIIQTDYWGSVKSEFDKHIQLHASFRFMTEDYLTNIQPVLTNIQSRLDQTIEKCKQGLWHSELSSNLLLLQRDLTSVLSTHVNLTDKLTLLSAIYNGLRTGAQSSKREEQELCNKAMAMLPTFASKKSYSMQ